MASLGGQNSHSAPLSLGRFSAACSDLGSMSKAPFA